jgi:hypothetical protein
MLLITLSVETFAHFWMRENTWLFNIFIGFEFIFYFWLYSGQIESRLLKKTFLLFIPIFVIVALLNIFFYQGLYKFNTYTHSFGSILISVCAISYYKQLLNNDSPQPLTKVPMFWIGTGLLVFYACNIFFTGLFHYILSVSMSLATQLFTIVQILNIIMYSLFTVGIVCSAMRQK